MSTFDAPLLSRAAADGRYASIVGQGGIFNVKTYGALGDGTTDDTLAIQTAANAAYAYANSAIKPAVVYFPSATYIINGYINWNGTNLGLVVFRGAPATIKFGSANTLFLNGTMFYSLGDYGNITIEDLIFDNNNTGKQFPYNGIIFNFDKPPSGFTSLKNIMVRRCEVKNAPRPTNFSDPFVVCFNINIYTNTEADRLKNITIDSITVQDCVFGKVGYGGSFGVRIQSNLTGGSKVTPWDRARDPRWESNHFYNNIVLKRIWHDGGPSSNSTYFSDSNYIVGAGGHGDNLVCEDLYGDHSGDDGLEVNSFLNVDINRCQFANSFTGNSILLTNGGGMPYPERQRISIRNSTVGATDSTNGNSAVTTRYVAGAPHGTIIMDGVKLLDAQILIRGAYQQLALRNIDYINTIGWTNGGPVDICPIEIDHLAGKGMLQIDGVVAQFNGVYANPNNTANSYVSFGAVRLKTATDLLVDIRNLEVVNNITASGTTMQNGGPSIAVLKLPVSLDVGNSGYATRANFDGSSNGAFWFDSGASTDVVVSGGTLNPSNTATLTNELRTVAYQGSNDYWTYALGPQTDVCVEATWTPGTTVSGFKAGIVGKNLSPTNFISAYVYDDGTNSYLFVDKIVGGTRTSLLGTATNGGAGTVTDLVSPPSYVGAKGIQLASRITTGTAFWVRFKQQGATVKADYHSASMGYGSTSTQNATVTLTTNTDVAMFVESSGYPGYTWVPQSTNATMDNFYYWRTYVMSGAISNLAFSTQSGTPIGSVYSVTNGLTQATTRIVNGPLRVVNSGMGRHSGLTTTATLDTLSDMGAFIKTEGNNLANGTMTTLTVPSSGTAYVNASGYTEAIYWYGGTLTTPYVEVSVNGGTSWSQIRGTSTDGSVHLYPGDQIRWTYSVVPTVKRTGAA